MLIGLKHIIVIACALVIMMASFNTGSKEKMSVSNKHAYFSSIDKSEIEYRLRSVIRIPQVKRLKVSDNVNVLIGMQYMLEDLLRKEVMPSENYIRKHSILIAACPDTNNADTVYLPLLYGSNNVLISKSGCDHDTSIGLCCDLEPFECLDNNNINELCERILSRYFSNEAVKRMRPLVFQKKGELLEIRKEPLIRLLGLMSNTEFCVIANSTRLWGVLPGKAMYREKDCFKLWNDGPTPPFRPRTNWPKAKHGSKS